MKLKHLGHAACVGVGATAVMDVGAQIIQRTTGTPPLNLDLVGRWIGHMRRGAFAHESIMTAEPVEHEHEIGLVAHYAIGVGFALALAAVRPGWLDKPTLVPAMTAGLATCAAPWLLMQPAWGMGLAASTLPDPATTRLRTVRAHAMYGLGLWASARVPMVVCSAENYWTDATSASVGHPLATQP
ncbi:DUF2938 domain-containing protein [Dermatophilus congolensis]|nr:DUF2938 domain-containing protein [Dermatophilus congolensis]MBO3128818.1 DUF2938 domain-containing protein [Dermatophilus congolensis]MBO3132544.1 DUF2938 domain-containing protein [Dermatophilus congolensis]MBO3133295.1 DUF2938 domain-containing protein [Dermatophilus congolensis]MBO3135530.1 DUF2938 domain-containing protein [Dermatophilus congolensis]MBO3137769.1 DUF2938 domain-containing protein [Dermatophilus congolensis]